MNIFAEAKPPLNLDSPEYFVYKKRPLGAVFVRLVQLAQGATPAL